MITKENLIFLGLVFGTFSAFFKGIKLLLNYYRTRSNNHKELIEWLNDVWNKLDRSNLLKLPEIVIQLVLDGRTSLSEKIISFIDIQNKRRPLVKTIGYFSLILFLWVGSYFKWGIIASLIAISYSLLLVFIAMVFVATPPHDEASKKSDLKRAIFILVSSTILFWTATYICASFLLKFEILYSAISMLVFFPFFCVSVFLPIVYINTFMSSFNIKLTSVNNIILSVLAICLSISTTLTFLLIGHILNPTITLPHSMQMLISNIIFDGLTVYFTIIILEWAIKKKSLIRIYAAMTIDLIVSATLACLSLYCALVFTKYSLTIKEILFVLIGKSYDGTNWDIGPYFWIMHTTLIPTIFYLLIILFCSSSKTIVIPIYEHLGLIIRLSDPLSHTISILNFFIYFFAVICTLTILYVLYLLGYY